MLLLVQQIESLRSYDENEYEYEIFSQNNKKYDFSNNKAISYEFRL